MTLDGVVYEVDWSAMSVGTSFFIPCIDIKTARRTIVAEATLQGYAVLVKDVVEDGFRGLRVWRV